MCGFIALDRAVRGKMDPTLARAALFPPPTAGAFALTRLDGASARGAADTGKSSGVEGMHGHVVGARVFLHLGAGPIGQRVQLEPPPGLLDPADTASRLRLFAPQARGPNLE